MRLALVVAIVGCGRVDFADHAAKPCLNPVGHDEDGDGVDDACDGCPQLADPEQIDSDGDGVDDLCDPNPTTPGDAIAFFDPFTSLRPEWTFTQAKVTQSGDDLLVDGIGGAYTAGTLAMVPGNDVYAMGFALTALDAGAENQVLISMVQDPDHSYYCELLDNPPSTPAFGLTRNIDETYSRLATGSMPVLATGELRLELANAPPSVSCTTTWPANPSLLTGQIPSGMIPTQSQILLGGVAASIHWFIIISSP